MEYRGISEAEHHRVLHEIKIDRQALIDFYNMFPKETRERVARIISDRELENIKQGEYDVTQGTVS